MRLTYWWSGDELPIAQVPLPGDEGGGEPPADAQLVAKRLAAVAALLAATLLGAVSNGHQDEWVPQPEFALDDDAGVPAFVVQKPRVYTLETVDGDITLSWLSEEDAYQPTIVVRPRVQVSPAYGQEDEWFPMLGVEEVHPIVLYSIPKPVTTLWPVPEEDPFFRMLTVEDEHPVNLFSVPKLPRAHFPPPEEDSFFPVIAVDDGDLPPPLDVVRKPVVVLWPVPEEDPYVSAAVTVVDEDVAPQLTVVRPQLAQSLPVADTDELLPVIEESDAPPLVVVARRPVILEQYASDEWFPMLGVDEDAEPLPTAQRPRPAPVTWADEEWVAPPSVTIVEEDAYLPAPPVKAPARFYEAVEPDTLLGLLHLHEDVYEPVRPRATPARSLGVQDPDALSAAFLYEDGYEAVGPRQTAARVLESVDPDALAAPFWLEEDAYVPVSLRVRTSAPVELYALDELPVATFTTVEDDPGYQPPPALRKPVQILDVFHQDELRTGHGRLTDEAFEPLRARPVRPRVPDVLQPGTGLGAEPDQRPRHFEAEIEGPKLVWMPAIVRPHVWIDANDQRVPPRFGLADDADLTRIMQPVTIRRPFTIPLSHGDDQFPGFLAVDGDAFSTSWETDEVSVEVVTIDECVVVGRSTTREIAPFGVGSEAEFTNVYFTVEAWTQGLVRITPIVDGDVKYDCQRTIEFTASGYFTRRYEQALYEPVMRNGREVGRKALRGTWFRMRVEVIDELGVGRINVGGFELECEPATLRHPEQVYQYENAAPRVPPLSGRFLFFGLQDSDDLLEYRVANDDTGEAVPIYARSRNAAPRGPGSEMIFTQVSIPIYRFNTVPVTLLVTPIVDGVHYPVLPIELPATPIPIRDVHHVDPYRILTVGDVEKGRLAIRGTWWKMNIESVEGVPAGTIRFGRVELECEVVTESAEAL